MRRIKILPEELVAQFNAKFAVGDPVVVTRDDGSRLVTKVKHQATLMNGNMAVGWVEGISGAYDLRRLSGLARATDLVTLPQDLSTQFKQAGREGAVEYGRLWLRATENAMARASRAVDMSDPQKQTLVRLTVLSVLRTAMPHQLTAAGELIKQEGYDA